MSFCRYGDIFGYTEKNYSFKVISKKRPFSRTDDIYWFMKKRFFQNDLKTRAGCRNVDIYYKRFFKMLSKKHQFSRNVNIYWFMDKNYFFKKRFFIFNFWIITTNVLIFSDICIYGQRTIFKSDLKKTQLILEMLLLLNIWKNFSKRSKEKYIFLVIFKVISKSFLFLEILIFT